MTTTGLETLRELVERRIPAAIKRITDGHGPMRIPAEDTDVDLVLAASKQALTALLAEYERMRECATSYIEALDRCEVSGNDGADVYEADQALAALRATLKEGERG